jgi:hypothetical protein
MSAPYLCDWWMPSRSKCDKPATVEARDAHGARLRFCRKHWRLMADPEIARSTWYGIVVPVLG